MNLLCLCSVCHVYKQYECDVDCQNPDVPHIQQTFGNWYHHTPWDVPAVERYNT